MVGVPSSEGRNDLRTTRPALVLEGEGREVRGGGGGGGGGGQPWRDCWEMGK